jgi:hypothetical protein
LAPTHRRSLPDCPLDSVIVLVDPEDYDAIVAESPFLLYRSQFAEGHPNRFAPAIRSTTSTGRPSFRTLAGWLLGHPTHEGTTVYANGDHFDCRRKNIRTGRQPKVGSIEEDFAPGLDDNVC